MRYILKDTTCWINDSWKTISFVIADGRIAQMVPSSSQISQESGDVIFNCKNKYIFPGFIDVHVHLREPGFFYKETIASGSKAAARGGYTHICAMPNLKPVPDSLEHLQEELKIIESSAAIHVLPYGAITKNEAGEEMADLEDMAPYVIAFSDDGRGVQDPAMMKEAMLRARSLGKLIAAHCEDNSLLHGGYIHDGEYARLHGHKGICSESEWGPIARDAELCRETGCSYHVCHISTAESVEIIRKAKSEGIDITCETGPHYLTMCDMDLQEDGRFRMNPPIRSSRDRDALLAGLKDGTIDMIATDHAPHSAEEKSRGLAGSAFGVVGIETAFPVLYTRLVKTGFIRLNELVDLMTVKPGRRFGIDTSLKEGSPACFCLYDLDKEYTIDPADFLSMGKSTPFEGWTVNGACLMTVCDGRIAYRSPDCEAE